MFTPLERDSLIAALDRNYHMCGCIAAGDDHDGYDHDGWSDAEIVALDTLLAKVRNPRVTAISFSNRHGMHVEIYANPDDATAAIRRSILEDFERWGVTPPETDDIDDLMQEVWVRVFAKLDGLKARDMAGLRSWLRQIARNCCHDALRRRGQRSESAVAEPEAPFAESSDRRQDHEHHETRTRVLTRLAPEERVVLWLRGTQSLPWETVRLIMRKASARVARGVYSQAKHRVPVLGSLY